MKKVISLLPFIILCLFVGFCWYQLIPGYNPTPKDLIALILTIINVPIYFWNRRFGVLFTGIILLLASFSLVHINFIQNETAYFFRIGSLRISFPSINYLSFSIFVFYIIANYSILQPLYKKVFTVNSEFWKKV